MIHCFDNISTTVCSVPIAECKNTNRYKYRIVDYKGRSVNGQGTQYTSVGMNEQETSSNAEKNINDNRFNNNTMCVETNNLGITVNIYSYFICQ